MVLRVDIHVKNLCTGLYSFRTYPLMLSFSFRPAVWADTNLRFVVACYYTLKPWAVCLALDHVSSL